MEMVIGKKIARHSSNGAVKTMRPRLTALAILLCASPLGWAQSFTFEIASPVAAQDFRFKTAAFVFRTAGCPEPGKADVSATAEGLVGSARRSMVLRVVTSSKPGVYAVPQQWDTGQWVVVLKGSCGEARAGAIIPSGPRGFVREASKFYTHQATAAEIEGALKAIPERGYK